MLQPVFKRCIQIKWNTQSSNFGLSHPHRRKKYLETLIGNKATKQSFKFGSFEMFLAQINLQHFLFREKVLLAKLTNRTMEMGCR